MHFMKHFGTGILILLILLLVTGCTQSSPAPIPQSVPTTTTPAITALETPIAVFPTSTPQAVVTVIHYIAPVKGWKDTELLMAFKVPQDWNVTTRLVDLPEGSQGLVYQTDLVSNDIFTIRSFPIGLNEDQAYRDTFRTWIPAPVQTPVTYNGITFDRFESSKDGKTHVGYVVQKASANDIGFANVLVFTADASHPFEKEDFENVVASFRYFTSRNADTVIGEEIPRVR